MRRPRRGASTKKCCAATEGEGGDAGWVGAAAQSVFARLKDN